MNGWQDPNEDDLIRIGIIQAEEATKILEKRVLTLEIELATAKQQLAVLKAKMVERKVEHEEF